MFKRLCSDNLLDGNVGMERKGMIGGNLRMWHQATWERLGSGLIGKEAGGSGVATGFLPV